MGDTIERRIDLRRYAKLIGALLVASCISPAGPGTWAGVVNVGRFLSGTNSLPLPIGELTSPFSNYEPNLAVWSFRIGLPIVLALAVAARRRIGWGALLVLLLAAIFASRSRRGMPLFGITAAFVLPLALTDVADRLPVLLRRWVAICLAAVTLLLGLTGTWDLLSGRFFLARNEDRRISLSLSRGFPGLQAAHWIRQERIEGPIFNPPLLSGALVLENGYRMPPFLDARWVGTPETLAGYARLHYASDETVKAIWDPILGSRKFETVMLDTQKMPALLRQLSLNATEWVPVHVDDGTTTFCRRGGANQDAIDRDAEAVLRSRAVPDPSREEALGQAVIRFLGTKKPSLLRHVEFPYPLYREAERDVALRRRPDAQEAYLALLRNENGSLWLIPSLPKVLSDLFWCLQQSDQPRAIIALADAIELREKLTPGRMQFLHEQRTRAYEKLGRSR